jgi:iron complex transport system permease protein
LAVGVGAALATTGVLFQALLRNPLAEPYILGISNGSAIGAIVGYMLGLGAVGAPALSFISGAIVVLAVLRIGRGAFGLRSESMLLGGVMVGAITAALIFLLLHFVGPQLRSAIQWMLGDLSAATAGVGYASLGLFVIVVVVSLLSGDRLNALALGDDEAASLGVDVSRSRTIAYLLGSFLVGLSVAFCGAIGFIGLVVPHILRRIVGPDHRALLPASAFGGAIFLIICDTLARSLMTAVDATASELPVGAVTALVGAPIFIYLLRKREAEQ